jgi:hypothetical protein
MLGHIFFPKKSLVPIALVFFCCQDAKIHQKNTINHNKIVCKVGQFMTLEAYVCPIHKS